MDQLKKIMLVEDDEDIQEIVKMALASVGGFDIVAVSSGQAALDALLQVKPQLILLDVMMPLMDGPTTLIKLKQMPEGGKTPVVFMTAKVQPYEMDAYKGMGVAGVISKPFDPMTLSQTILDIWKQCGTA